MCARPQSQVHVGRERRGRYMDASASRRVLNELVGPVPRLYDRARFGRSRTGCAFLAMYVTERALTFDIEHCLLGRKLGSKFLPCVGGSLCNFFREAAHVEWHVNDGE